MQTRPAIRTPAIRILAILASASTLIGLTGCVERRIWIDTDPPGALVWLNDAQLGRTPVAPPITVSFDAITNRAGVAQPACTRCGDCCGGSGGIQAIECYIDPACDCPYPAGNTGTNGDGLSICACAG